MGLKNIAVSSGGAPGSRLLLLRQGFLLVFVAQFLTSCAYLTLDPSYKGPPGRPPEIESYYARGGFGTYSEQITHQESDYAVWRIKIQSSAGLITVDYYKRPKVSENLILVFPLLGGKNVVAEHFADYFSRRGYDCAIVHRVNDFKDPANFNRLEEIFRDGVKRDRIALDFFEREKGKKNFASFGISRGAINVAITAGIDSRLKYNVMVMGGSDLVRIFETSTQKGIKKYRKRVMAALNLSKEEFFQRLREQIKTDPKRVAQYIDASNSLLVLGVLDSTVPFKRGRELRREMGGPSTIYLLADHYTSVLYTQFVRLVPPVQNPSFPSFMAFPMDYIEREALGFYDRKLKKRRFNPMIALYRVLQFPVNVALRVLGE